MPPRWHPQLRCDARSGVRSLLGRRFQVPLWLWWLGSRLVAGRSCRSCACGSARVHVCAYVCKYVCSVCVFVQWSQGLSLQLGAAAGHVPVRVRESMCAFVQ
jgi:hypothetical protein